MNRKIVSAILAAEVILNLCGCSAGAAGQQESSAAQRSPRKATRVV